MDWNLPELWGGVKRPRRDSRLNITRVWSTISKQSLRWGLEQDFNMGFFENDLAIALPLEEGRGLRQQKEYLLRRGRRRLSNQRVGIRPLHGATAGDQAWTSM